MSSSPSSPSCVLFQITSGDNSALVLQCATSPLRPHRKQNIDRREAQWAGRKAPGNHGTLRKQQQKRRVKRERKHKQEHGVHGRINDTTGRQLRSTYSDEPVPLGPLEVSRSVFRLRRAGSALWRLESRAPRGLNVNCGLRHFTRMPLLRAAMQPSCWGVPSNSPITAGPELLSHIAYVNENNPTCGLSALCIHKDVIIHFLSQEH